MNKVEKIKLKGNVSITILDSNGNIKENRTINNLIVNSGLQFITARMLADTQPPMSHIALGTSPTAVSSEQTQLIAQAGIRRTATVTNPSISTVQFYAVFPAGFSTGLLTEAAIFNADAGGTMLCRTVFSEISKTEFDIAIISWVISLAAV